MDRLSSVQQRVLAFANAAQLQDVVDAIGASAAVFDVTAANIRLAAANDLFHHMTHDGFVLDDVDVDGHALGEAVRVCWDGRHAIDREIAFTLDGKSHWWRCILTPILDSFAEAGRVFLTAVDITEKRELERALDDSRQRLDSMIENAYDAIVVCAEDQTVRHFNQAAENIFGWRAFEVIGRPLSLLLPSHVQGKHDYFVRDFATSEIHARTMHGRMDIRAARRDGEEFYAEISISKCETDQGMEFTAIIRDVTDKINLLQRLQKEASTDSLTGLKNRRCFYDELDDEISRAKRYGHGLSVVVLDIDNFKAINDSCGHQIGDAVICMVADCARAAIRDVDGAGRIGGEEFAVYLPYACAKEARIVAERIRLSIEQAVVDNAPATAASFGLSCYQVGDSGDDLVNRADHRLYEAKRTGKNCTVGPEPGQRE